MAIYRSRAHGEHAAVEGESKNSGLIVLILATTLPPPVLRERWRPVDFC